MPVHDVLSKTFGCDGAVVSKQATLTVLHAAVRARGWRVVALHWNKYPMSFHLAALETESGPMALLVHADRPVAALVPGEPKYMSLTFLDDPALSRALAACGALFAILQADDLALMLTADDTAFLRTLGRDYVANLDYWRPRTIGEVIFNWWD